MKFQPIYVQWLDSVALTRGWHRENVFRDQATKVGLVHESIGFLLKEEPDYIVICQNRGLEPDEDGEVNVSEATQIPKVAIVFRSHFGVPGRAKRLDFVTGEAA